MASVLKRLVPRPLQPFARGVYRSLRRRWLSWREGPQDRAYARSLGLPALPPAELRFRVHGDTEREGFVTVARRCCEDIEAALGRVGRSLESFETLLDFGCGCGRHLLFLANRPAAPKCYGTDIDGDAIAWCRRTLTFAEFNVNGPLPPLEYASEMFDLIVAVSVFTHLDEEHQVQWLEELSRVAKPGAIFLCTVHGPHIWQNLPDALRAEVERDGFLFVRSADWKGTFPDWYQTAYHTEEYVRRTFRNCFEVVEYLPRGLVEHQDLVILRKG